ncbi:prolyl oligopeptidase family serine peptidase [Flavobacterium sp.]|uniref:prolyl oligopeptidase family serine peptidase n=1 Tax=Flavobacterium sp. TaxID=239 RepID=UPI0026364E0C|nr:prolyl oligopeptidase family serine peptidase [Flavobacterium sp.]
MKNTFLILFCSLTTLLFSQTSVETKKTPTIITKNNVSFQDDYTWLEDMRSEEVTNWVGKQTEISNAHFAEIKKDYNLGFTIKEYDTRSTHSIPDKKGKYFYALYYKDKKKTPSLYYFKSLDDEPVEIVNPNKIYPESNVTILTYNPSKNSASLAFKVSIDGSDKHEIRFVDMYKNKLLDDVLKNVKFSNVAWNKDRGVFYKKNINKNQFDRDSTFQLFYHRIGTLQEDDELISDLSKTEGNISFFTSKNNLFVIESNKEGTEKKYYYSNLDSEVFKLERFIDNQEDSFHFINFKDGRVYFSSNKFNWGEVKSFDIKNNKDEKNVIPQIYMSLLEGTCFSDDYIICKYRALGKNYIIFYDYQGVFVKRIDVPTGYEVELNYFDEETKDCYFGVYSYTVPYRNFKVNILEGKAQPFYSMANRPKPTLFPLDYFETKIITYKSRDNVDIPITIVHKKGIPLDGNNPTLLKAYGGFGTISGANYDTGLLYFLEKGGVFAYAEIRGGGEKGFKWHQDGMGLKKKNTFNDFIDAAEFLIKEKYTSASKLAITGGSQGGLLVGVAMTQRPELFKVAVPTVGVFDMAKFDDYTVGRFHHDEYGNPQKELDYKYMLDYSPFHNIKEDVNYPITLIITSDNDDRVPPVHSYKFAAKLQNRAAQKNPIFLKTIQKAGHYGNFSSYDKRVQDKAEFYSFLLYHLNR